MAGITSGTDLRISVATNPLAYATSCSLSMSAETRESVSKDSTSSWQDSTVGQLSASLSFEGFFTIDDTINSNNREDFEGLFDNFSGKTQIAWTFSTGTTGDVEYSGNGYITSLDSSAPVEENATYSGTITVTGAVSKATIA